MTAYVVTLKWVPNVDMLVVGAWWDIDSCVRSGQIRSKESKDYVYRSYV